VIAKDQRIFTQLLATMFRAGPGPDLQIAAVWPALEILIQPA